MKKLICILMFLPLFLSGVSSDALENELENIIDKNQLQSGFTESEKEVSGEPEIDGTYDVGEALKRLCNKSLEIISQKLKDELGYGMELIALGLFCAVANVLSKDKSILAFINISACCAASMIVAGQVDSITAQAKDVMIRLSDYSKAAMPAVFSAAALSGAPASSAAKYAAASLSIDILISTAVNYILPMISLFISIAISRSIFDNSILSALTKMIKWMITSLMTIMTMAFTAYISFTGLITGSVDAAAVKTTRTLIANTLPVVGKLISDASSVILAGASIVKNSAGVYCLIAVCSLCAGPFISMAIKMLIYKAAAAACDMLPGSRLSGLINDLGTAFSMLLGLVGCCGIMLFISFVSGIKVLV